MNHLNQLAGSLFHPLSVPYNYKYNGKELQETGMYDYGWRHYMPDIGRWSGMDQLSEKYHSFSPYAYVANNPVSFTDPDGRKIDPIEGGWNFTGSDINLVLSYFGAGGDFGDLFSQLGDYEGGFGSGPVSDFWNSFNSHDILGGINVKNGWLTWSTNYGENGNGILQGIQMNSTKINQNAFDSFMGDTRGMFDYTKMGLDFGGGLYGALQNTVANEKWWLGSKGGFNSTSLLEKGTNGKYTRGVQGYRNGYASALKEASKYKWAGRATVGVSVAIGSVEIYNGYQMDGGFGYNAQVATASTAGSLAGGWAGAALGAKVGAGIGVWFGGAGAIPGAIIGGLVGGIVGGFAGSTVGEAGVDYYYDN